MVWAELIGQILKLGILIVGEVFAQQKAARERKERFELNLAIFNAAAQVALDRMRREAKKESDQAHDIEDEVDDARNPRP